MITALKFINKLLMSSYLVGDRIAITKKLYNIGETLILPCMKDICDDVWVNLHL